MGLIRSSPGEPRLPTTCAISGIVLVTVGETSSPWSLVWGWPMQRSSSGWLPSVSSTTTRWRRDAAKPTRSVGDATPQVKHLAGASAVCSRALPNCRGFPPMSNGRRSSKQPKANLDLTRFDGHLKTGDTCPDGVRLNGQALEAQVHQRVQSRYGGAGSPVRQVDRRGLS